MNDQTNNPIEQDEELAGLDAELRATMPVEAPVGLAERIEAGTAEAFEARAAGGGRGPVLARIGPVARWGLAAALLLAAGLSVVLDRPVVKDDVVMDGGFDVPSGAETVLVMEMDELSDEIATLSDEIEHLSAGLDAEWANEPDDELWLTDFDTF